MTKLYTLPGTCALAPNIAAHWLNAPVEIETLERGQQKEDWYLEINPLGQVPALVFDDGDVMTEAAAIMTYLGAEYGTEGYARDKRLGRCEAEALSYMTSEVHADYAGHFAPGSLIADESQHEAIKEKTYEKLRGHYQRLNDRMAGEFYLSERSFADAYLYVITRWIEMTPLSIDDYPKLKAFRARMERDESVKTALAKQKMEPVAAS
ncbi:glutathione S-transferase [Pacificimonas flava]|uniref:Glutathione S-transferase n=2 Tax=Pacificimonas TaxID=1960290 RepID=A0A219B2J3_9SPHN|nr:MULTISPECIES: glutathione S-transferase N-terminal domain-containing protein [Pacificimonas]MBZ6377743.1 glutathione S-transferase N-terminal domain-containing protein [Pacificimonas aurantium]OWV32582.1 glutathione S-transferase [Pacificimonas flava]